VHGSLIKCERTARTIHRLLSAYERMEDLQADAPICMHQERLEDLACCKSIAQQLNVHHHNALEIVIWLGFMNLLSTYDTSDCIQTVAVPNCCQYG
jgi:hypothetical protein